MATNWEAKFGKGKWVTVRGARVYIQEGKGLGSALQKLAGKKKTIKSPERKIPKLDDTTKKVIKRNEETMRKNAPINVFKEPDQFKAGLAAGEKFVARNLNRDLKRMIKPGRGDTHRVMPASGNAEAENAAIMKAVREYAEMTNNPDILKNEQFGIKRNLKTARAARKAAGTNGKLRSPVYADQKTGELKLASKPLGKGTKTFTNEKDREAVEKGIDARTVKRNEETIKNVRKDPNAIIKPIKTSKARIAIAENSAIKRKNQPGLGEWQNSYDQLNAGDSTVANAFSKKTNRYPKIQQYEVKNNIKEAQAARKRHGTEGKLRSDVYKSAPQQEAAAKAKKSAQKTKTTRGGTSTPTLKEALKEKPAKKAGTPKTTLYPQRDQADPKSDPDKALFTAPMDKHGRVSLGDVAALRYGPGEIKFRKAADALKSGKHTGTMEESILTGEIKNGVLLKDGVRIRLSDHDMKMRKVYDSLKKDKSSATPSLHDVLEEKVNSQKKRK